MTEPLLAPRANPRLLGHEAAEAAFLDAFRAGRLPHAWLITGPSGIGKATFAHRVARFLMAGGRPDATGLDLPLQHPTFRRAAAGGHADLLTIERNNGDDERKRRSREIPVEEIRRIDPFLRLTAAEGAWRAVIVDEAEAMNRNGANALLKILEEPPARAILLLTCGNPGALLPTIRSRCRHLALEPLPDMTVDRLLAEHAPELDPAERASLVRLAEGSIGRATSLLEEGGLSLYRDMVALLDDFPRVDFRAVHKMGDRIGPVAAESSWRLFSELLVWWMARLARAAARGTEPPEIVAGEGTVMQRVVGALGRAGGLDRWVELWDNTRRLFAQADGSNLDRKQVLLQAFIGIERACNS
jgi:DNA polymerase-3 subunit delta'